MKSYMGYCFNIEGSLSLGYFDAVSSCLDYGCLELLQSRDTRHYIGLWITEFFQRYSSKVISWAIHYRVTTGFLGFLGYSYASIYC